MLFSKYKYDAFIVHAVEDKQIIGNELCEKLKTAGFKIWYSSKDLVPGKSIVSVIHDGLNRSRCGIIIITPNFLLKKWPQREYHILLAKEDKSDPNIFPVLSDVTTADLSAFDPDIVNRYSLDLARGPEFVTTRIVEALKAKQRKEIARQRSVLTKASLVILVIGCAVFFKSGWDARKVPSQSAIRTLIDSRITTWSEKIDSGLHYPRGGNSLDRKEVLDLVDEFFNQKSYYRNEYEFTNGSLTLHSKKHVQENLNVDPTAFLQNKNLVFKDGFSLPAVKDHAKEVFYILKNKDSVSYTTSDGKFDVEHNTYSADVTFKNNIRVIVVHLTFATGAKDRRKNNVTIYGFLPREVYHLSKKEGNWIINRTEAPEEY